LTTMTGQYLSGQAANDWKSVGGDPFSGIYKGSPIQQAPPPGQPPITNTQPGATMHPMMRMGHTFSQGGNVRNTDLRRRLHKLKRFSIGGGNDYGFIDSSSDSTGTDTSNLFDPGTTYSTFNNQDIYPATADSGAPVDTSNLVSGGLSDTTGSSDPNAAVASD